MRMKKFVKTIGIIILSSVTFLHAQTRPSMVVDEQNHPLYYKGMAVVKLAKRPNGPSLQKGAKSTGMMSVDRIFSKHSVDKIEKHFQHKPIPENSSLPDLSRIYTIHFSEDQNVLSVVRELEKDPNVEYAEPVSVDRLLDVPDDSLYSSQSWLRQIFAEEAWDIHKGEDGDSTVIIGVVDTGVDWKHPDLIDNFWHNLGEDADGDGHVFEWDGSEWKFDPDDENGIDDDGNGYTDDFVGWNFCSSYDFSGDEGNDPGDPAGHGTHVAGIAAGVTGNGKGIASISWNVKLLAAAHAIYLPDFDDYYILDGEKGIVYLAENGADVINASFGGGYSQAKQDAVDYARALGSIVVAAAGNSASEELEYPAACTGVIGVGNLKEDDVLSSWSNRGAYVDVCAPGNQILSTVPDGQYASKSGTSMASPLVAGLLGLIKSMHPDWSCDQLVLQLLSTADNIDALNPGLEHKLGAGRINAYRALTDSGAILPAEYRLAWHTNIVYQGEDGSKIPNLGQRGSFTFTVGNYSSSTNGEPVTFTLSTEDPDIEIIEGEFSEYLNPEDVTTFTDVFNIRVKEGAKPHVADFTISAQSETPIYSNAGKSFDILVAPSGILVIGYAEADFIESFLKNQQLDVLRLDSVPADLTVFDAVFFTQSYGITPELVRNYLENGGRLYVQDYGILSNLEEDISLPGLFGLDRVEQGETIIRPKCIIGGEESLARDMVFTGTAQSFVDASNIYYPNENGTSLLQIEDYGVVGVQGQGEYGQKTVCLSYDLSNLLENASPSGRQALLARILNFFDIETKMFTDFSCERTNDYESFNIQFRDLSLASGAEFVDSWAWDFDGDGVTDSQEANPLWTYTSPGVYDVSLIVSKGAEVDTLARDSTVTIYINGGGITSVDYGSDISVPGDSSMDQALNRAMSMECMVWPDTMAIEELGGWWFPLWNKSDALILCLYDDLSLDIEIELEDGSWDYVYADVGAVTPNTWNHIVVTFDSDSGRVILYINGQEMDRYEHDEPGVALTKEYSSPLNEMISFGGRVPGIMDEVRLWDRALSDQEVKMGMNNTLTGQEPGLVAWWPLDEGCGDLAMDRTEHGYVGYISNMKRVEGFKPAETLVQESGDETVPLTFAFEQNYPNPFNPATVIGYSLPERKQVVMTIYDVLGRRVRQLVNRTESVGKHSVLWDATDDYGQRVATGIYFCEIRAGEFRQSRKMLLMK